MLMKRSLSDKMLLLQKHQKKKNTADSQSVKNVKNNRFLITINVIGSAGPIRFVVNEDDRVSGVIETTLKAYARLGRLPVLGSDVNNFLLYQANAVFEALDPCERIGSHGGRMFVLYKKSQPQIAKGVSEMIAQKGGGGGGSKDRVNSSPSFRILLSH